MTIYVSWDNLICIFLCKLFNIINPFQTCNTFNNIKSKNRFTISNKPLLKTILKLIFQELLLFSLNVKDKRNLYVQLEYQYLNKSVYSKVNTDI